MPWHDVSYGVVWYTISCNQIKLKTKQNKTTPNTRVRKKIVAAAELKPVILIESTHTYTQFCFRCCVFCVDRDQNVLRKKIWMPALESNKHTHSLSHSMMMICIFCYAHSNDAFTQRERSEIACSLDGKMNLKKNTRTHITKLSLSWACPFAMSLTVLSVAVFSLLSSSPRIVFFP